jgi:hypothetical protein
MAGTVVDTKELSELKWPVPAADVERSKAVSLDTLLQALQLAASDEDRQASTDDNLRWDSPTPASMQVIKSGALALTKTWTKFVTGAGGLTAALSAIVGGVVAAFNGASDPIAVTLLGGAALIISFVAIALALFVKGDLEARGMATAARHQGRADVAAMFLQATAMMPADPTVAEHATAAAPQASFTDDLRTALASFPTTIKVTTKDFPTPTRVTGMARSGAEQPLRLKLETGDLATESEIVSFTTL